jgi:peptidyl-prolyl cis-trans isomerase-like 1
MLGVADGGTPEVTLQTSMGEFTVEVPKARVPSSFFFLFVIVFLPLMVPSSSGRCLRALIGQMYHKHAPKTCRNFIELSRRGNYNDVIFHRIIKVSLRSRLALLLALPSPAIGVPYPVVLMQDFIVQGGDPSGTGRGGESIYGSVPEY